MLENIALNKPATCISGGNAGYAVDNKPGTSSDIRSEMNPWWSVDLQKQTLITHVSIQMTGMNKCLLLTSILLHPAVQKHDIR